MQVHARLVALGLGTAMMLLGQTGSLAAAQDRQPCPFASDSVASAALGSPVQASSSTGTPPGLDVCEVGDFTIYRQSSPQSASGSGAGGLTDSIVLGLPAELAGQIEGLADGATLEVPGYQVTGLSGLGDAAFWAKDRSNLGVDALVVQRGSELFTFQVFDGPNAQASAAALAAAVLGNAPPAPTAGAPSGGPPAVLADCGLDVANAVADRLQRGDISSVNVIGGCHYVAIATTLDRSGFDSARQICDTASEVAYAGGLLGITVTDRDGHERASGADGQPCSGFP